MATHCLFGIFVFGSKSDTIYRFVTDDLFAYLKKCFIDRGYSLNEDSTDTNEVNQDPCFSVDDAIIQHFAVLTSVHTQTKYRNNPVRRVTLNSNIELFFEQIGESTIICVADSSFNSIIILKTINLFKALVKFHIGVLPFVKSETIDKSMNRISSSLQYYLNNISTNQALIFESCEYLHTNSVLRQQCLEACTTINQDVQNSLHTTPSIVLITCKDKIVYLHTSNNQNRPSNSDIFLLVLNNISRPYRDQFKEVSTKNKGHIYKTRHDQHHHTKNGSTEDNYSAHNRRSHSLPNFTHSEATKIPDDDCIEVVFMKTSNRSLAPFTMYTIPLTDEISAIILLEWKSSLACSHLSELIRQLDICTQQLQFTYNRLNNLVKSIENNNTIRRYFESRKMSTSIFSNILSETKSIYKALVKRNDVINDNDQKGQKILTNLSKMNDHSIELFHHLCFDTNEYVISNNNNNQPNNDNQLFEPPKMSQILREKLSMKLEDWFSFVEIKSQRNITMTFCQNDFPGLVHFALIDRLRGHICTPALFNDDNQNYLSINSNINGMEHFLEKKILKFELDCLSALQRGCTSFTMTDEHFTYNYTLRLQESNGASMRLYKPFVKSQPPGILHYDFYRALAYENYSSIVDQTSLECFELICVHLRIVPSNYVREQCEQLWPRLMEIDE